VLISTEQDYRSFAICQKILQIQAPFNCKPMQSDEDGQIQATPDCPHWDQITFLMEREGLPNTSESQMYHQNPEEYYP
jgi:hypothetical protein